MQPPLHPPKIQPIDRALPHRRQLPQTPKTAPLLFPRRTHANRTIIPNLTLMRRHPRRHAVGRQLHVVIITCSALRVDAQLLESAAPGAGGGVARRGERQRGVLAGRGVEGVGGDGFDGFEVLWEEKG